MTDWLGGKGQRFGGKVESHGVNYTPSRWKDISPWPQEFVPVNEAGSSVVTRGEVVKTARRCSETGTWEELLVASFVWGVGPVGYGPSRLSKLLTSSSIGRALDEAIAELRADEAGDERPAVSAYRSLLLEHHIRGLGPAFFTKFLYFAGKAIEVEGPKPLILDAVLARAVREQQVLHLDGAPYAKRDAATTWPTWGWSPYRYGLYLDVMERVASAVGVDTDVAELALFKSRQ